MLPIVFDVGSTLNIADTLANLGFLGTFTQVFPSEEIRILVDTSIAREVILPSSTVFPIQNVKITVVDITGNAATNSITVSPSGSDTINGTGSFIIAANFASDRFEVFHTDQYFTANYLGGTSAVVGANSGVHLSGSVVQLGGTLLSNTTINGLDTTFLQFTNADNSFLFAVGNLTPLGGSLTDKSLAALSSTSNQVFAFSIAKDDRTIQTNSDLVSNITRSISLTSTSALSAGAPNGAINLLETWHSTNFSYTIGIVSQSLNLGIINHNLTAPNQQPAQLLINNTQILCYKYLDNTNQTSLVNGWVINSSPDFSSIFWHSSQSAFSGNPDGTILRLSSIGLSFIVSGSTNFLVSPTGQITATIPTSSAGLTSGMLWNNSGVVNIIP